MSRPRGSWPRTDHRVNLHTVSLLLCKRTIGAAVEYVVEFDAPAAPAQGRVINNPISGERIVIRKTGAETGGRLLAFELYLPPGGHVPAGHVHPEQEERFTMVSGRMRFRLGGRIILAGAGETVVVTAGRAHWFGNAGAGVSHAWVEVRPALRTEEMFVATEAISLAGHFPGTRLPRPSDLAFLLLEFRRELAVPNLPPAVVTAVLAPVAWLARRRRSSSRRRRLGH